LGSVRNFIGVGLGIGDKLIEGLPRGIRSYYHTQRIAREFKTVPQSEEVDYSLQNLENEFFLKSFVHGLC
jgi:hypothetical protein